MSILKKSDDCEINKNLIIELNKWKKTLKCMTLVHKDSNMLGNYSFIHERIYNKTTNTEYSHFVTNAIGNDGNNIYISYIYGEENFDHFKSKYINSDTIQKEIYPTLPMFNCKNSVNRLKKWNKIDSECKDIYWVGCVRSGLQFHNDGILSSKRLVSNILQKKMLIKKS